MKTKLIYDFRFFIWVLIAMLAITGALNSGSFGMFVIYSAVAVMSLFGVDVATRGFGYVIINLIAVAVSYFADGWSAALAATLLFLIPAYGMSETIKFKKDFTLTLSCGMLLMALGIMIIDRCLAVPSFGGLRVIFGSVIDAMGKAPGMAETFSAVMGVTVSEAESLIGTACYTMKLMFPGFVMSVVMVILIAALLGSRRIILGIPVPAFYRLKSSKAVAYAYCIGHIATMFMTSDSGVIVMNAVIVLAVLLIISGVSLVRFFTRLIPSKPFSVIVFIFALPVCCMLPQAVITAGLADAVFDFRRLKNVKK